MGPDETARILEQLRRFDRPGPRYTSYPTAVEFHEGVDAETYHRTLAAAAERKDAPLSLYAHLPFCEHRCLFCGCHVVITRHMHVAERYLEYVCREVEMLAARLPHRKDVVQMHWGGGTPTYFRPDQLEAFFNHVARHFRLVDGAEVAIEVDPRVTTRQHLETLAALGFNRLSLGVQDLDPRVQRAIDRNQTYEETERLIRTARELGFHEGINVDLIYGLPEQELDAFGESVDRVIELRPDRVALYSFAYVPWIKGHQKRMDPDTLPPPEIKLQLYLEGMRRFMDAGYEPIGMDHFALPEDELAVAARQGRLHRNFMGYSVMPAPDMVAVGVSGIGEVGHAFFQNEKKLSRYYEALDAGRMPVQRGYVLDADDRLRQRVIHDLMCNFRLDVRSVEAELDLPFREYFAPELAELEELVEAGFVVLGPHEIRVTETGRLFVRNVCMAFDRYLRRKRGERPVFSRTV